MTKLFLTIDNKNDKICLIRTDRVIETEEGFRPQFPNENCMTIPKKWVKAIIGCDLTSVQSAVIQIQEQRPLNEDFLLSNGFEKIDKEYIKNDGSIIIKENEIIKGYSVKIDNGQKSVAASQIEYVEQLDSLLNSVQYERSRRTI